VVVSRSPEFLTVRERGPYVADPPGAWIGFSGTGLFGNDGALPSPNSAKKAPAETVTEEASR